ncbi:MAG: hypothetical protein GWP03_00580 [Proteobacteria bacterium]|nr:hypothetical protein [Pseudomonadota bacterium]
MEKKRVVGILGVVFVFVMMFSSCSLFNNLFNKSRHERITNNPGRSGWLDIVEDSKGGYTVYGWIEWTA